MSLFCRFVCDIDKTCPVFLYCLFSSLYCLLKVYTLTDKYCYHIILIICTHLYLNTHILLNTQYTPTVVMKHDIKHNGTTDLPKRLGQHVVLFTSTVQIKWKCCNTYMNTSHAVHVSHVSLPPTSVFVLLYFKYFIYTHSLHVTKRLFYNTVRTSSMSS